jgi:predicted DNA-binding transcriptional regulator AlpA
MKRLLSKAEVGQMLGVSLRTVDRIKSRGLLPVTKVLSAVRFDIEDVQAFIQSQRSNSPGEKHEK